MADTHGTRGKRGDVGASAKAFNNIPLNVQRRILRFVNACMLFILNADGVPSEAKFIQLC